MEKTSFEQRSKEPQTSTINQLKKDVLGGDSQNAWLNVHICGWYEAISKKEDGSDVKSD